MVSTLSRRSLLGCACCAPMAASLALSVGAFTPAHAAGKTTDLTADQALQRLKDGNRKFMADTPDQTAAAAQMDNPRLNHERRLEIAQGQTPFAVLVSCSDSRWAIGREAGAPDAAREELVDVALEDGSVEPKPREHLRRRRL